MFIKYEAARKLPREKKNVELVINVRLYSNDIWLYFVILVTGSWNMNYVTWDKYKSCSKHLSLYHPSCILQSLYSRCLYIDLVIAFISIAFYIWTLYLCISFVRWFWFCPALTQLYWSLSKKENIFLSFFLSECLEWGVNCSYTIYIRSTKITTLVRI